MTNSLISTEIKLVKNYDYEKLVSFFIKNELEFTKEDLKSPADEILEIIGLETNDKKNETRLIGGVILAKRENNFIIDGIAVDKSFRKNNLGGKLLNYILKEAKVKNAKKIFLVARAPIFFKKFGFEKIAKEEAPKFFECFTCSQYKKNCFPEVLMKNITEI